MSDGSDDDWDADDWEAEPVVPVAGGAKKFDDEEEEDIEEVDATSKYYGQSAAELVKELERRDKYKADLAAGKGKAKKKSLKEAAEIERLAREMYLEEAAKTLSPEELWAKKVEDDKKAAAAAAATASGTGEVEADKATATAVAVPKKDAVEVTLIEAMNPKSATDFEIMARAVAKKASKYERSPHYMGSFLKTLSADICENLSAEDSKKWAGAINIITNNKNKAIKGKVKPKSKKPSLGGASKAGQGTMDNMYDNQYDDYM